MNSELKKLASADILLDIVLEKVGQSGLFIVDPAGAIAYVNQRAQALTGLPVAQLVGKNFFETITLTKEDGAALSENVHPVRKAIRAASFSQVTPFFCSYAKKKTAVSVALNTAQLKKGRKTLGALVQIREVKRTLNVGEMKSLFVSFAAHQLKTPSSIVKGFLELMIRQGVKAYKGDQWYNLQSAYESNENLIQLSKNLLNVTRLEGGLIEPKIGPFDPVEILQSKITSHKLLITVKKLKVIFNPPTKGIALNSDATFFSEIFEVLFGNALKYAPESSTITIEYTKEKGEVQVQVIDNGPGIGEDEQKTLFDTGHPGNTEPLENLPAEQTTSHGIGLLMAKKYVALLGGTIGVQSKEKQGSTFYFRIPNLPK